MLQVQWKVAKAGGEGSPAVSAAGVVYTSTYSGFIALVPATGATLWEWKPPDGAQIGSSLARTVTSRTHVDYFYVLQFQRLAKTSATLVL